MANGKNCNIKEKHMSKIYSVDSAVETIWEEFSIKSWSHFEAECEKLQSPANRQSSKFKRI